MHVDINFYSVSLYPLKGRICPGYWSFRILASVYLSRMVGVYIYCLPGICPSRVFRKWDFKSKFVFCVQGISVAVKSWFLEYNFNIILRKILTSLGIPLWWFWWVTLRKSSLIVFILNFEILVIINFLKLDNTSYYLCHVVLGFYATHRIFDTNRICGHMVSERIK